MCRNAVKIPKAKRTIIRVIVFSGPGLSSMSPAHIIFPCKAEQPLGGMELQEEKHKKSLQHTENLFRKNLLLTDAC